MKRAKDEEPLARILHHVFCRLLKYSKLNSFWRNIEKYWIKIAEKNLRFYLRNYGRNVVFCRLQEYIERKKRKHAIWSF